MSAREQLAARQAALLRALLAGGPPPPGFGEEALRVQADALRAKRRRVTKAVRPDLPAALGQRFGELFDRYALAHPRPVGSGARHDADQFASWLTDHGELSGRRSRRWRRRDAP